MKLACMSLGRLVAAAFCVLSRRNDVPDGGQLCVLSGQVAGIRTPVYPVRH